MTTIRKIVLTDVNKLLEFVFQLDNESDYLLYEPDERKTYLNITKNLFTRIINNKKSAIFIAEDDKLNIVGFICGEVSNLKRISHVMRVNIGVLKKYRRVGVAKKLAEALILYATNLGISRAEVTVIKNNQISLDLCKMFGFEIEGIKKSSLKIGDKYYDEYCLAKIL